MADNKEEKSEWEEILVPLGDLDLEADKKEDDNYDNGDLVPLDLESDEEKKYDNGPWVDLRDYKPNFKTRICPKCGREYNPEIKFCEEDGTKLIEIWKCRHCGEDLTKAQGYSAIKVCTNCGKSLDAMQQKSINSTKRVTKNPLKRICTNEKCGASYENNAKFCGNCGSPIVSMQCSCGEIFRQKEDGSFDKHCPVCGKPNPIEKEKQPTAEELSRQADKKYEAKEYSEALKLYRKAADQGYASAQFNLGVMYDNGQGVAQDYSEAVKWYKKAAEQGNASAQCNLGVMYENGYGVTKSYAEAVKWYRKAAEQGDAKGQAYLAEMYENGKGVNQDKAEAIKLYKMAADQGNEYAQNALKRLGL